MTTLYCPLAASLHDDRGRSLDRDVIELCEEDLTFEDVMEGWEEIFQADQAQSNDADEDDREAGDGPVTKRGEMLWIDEGPTKKFPAVLPAWVEAELRSAHSTSALKAG